MKKESDIKNRRFVIKDSKPKSKHNLEKLLTRKSIIDKKTGIVYALNQNEFPLLGKFHLKKSFLSGIASVINIPGNHYSYKNMFTPEKDIEAIVSDWNIVGNSILKATISEIEIQTKELIE